MIAALPGKKWPRDVVTIGHPALSTPCKDIKTVDFYIITLALEMIEAMDRAGGIGLASNQLGENLNMFVYRWDDKWEDDPKVVINPIILDMSDVGYEDEEGCLSIPGFFADLERPNMVRVGFIDLNEEYHEKTMTGYGANSFCTK